jgi:ribonuclease D
MKKFGLAEFSQKTFNVVLDKSHQRSNWTIRRTAKDDRIMQSMIPGF